MAGCKAIRFNSECEREQSKVDDQSNFRTRVIHRSKWNLPRRYVIAFMLCFLLIIQEWKEYNISISFVNVHSLLPDIANHGHPHSANWTMEHLDSLFTSLELTTGIIVPITAGILLIFVSSYRFLSLTSPALFLLHALTPLAFHRHPYVLVAFITLQRIFEFPITVAVFCMWKDWAPPSERARLLVISFAGPLFLSYFAPFYLSWMDDMSENERFPIVGAFGMVWSLLWVFVISDKPSSDPLITENEFLYLQSNIPPAVQDVSKVTEIPWIAILTSKPVYVLCLLYFKLSFSMLESSTIPLYMFLDDLATEFWIIFAFAVGVTLFASLFLLQFLLRKFRTQSLNIRKGFVCGALVLHSIILFGTFVNSPTAALTLASISHVIFYVSVPGFIALPLDLSSRFISVIAGIIGTFEILGFAAFTFYMEYAVDFNSVKNIHSWTYSLNALLSLVAAAAFFQWGSDEEQTWSLILYKRSSCDYKCYPKPDDNDDSNLVDDHI